MAVSGSIFQLYSDPWGKMIPISRAYVSTGWLNHQLDVDLCIFPLVWDLCVYIYTMYILSFEWFKLSLCLIWPGSFDSKRDRSHENRHRHHFNGLRGQWLVQGFRKPSVDHLFGLEWHHKPSSFFPIQGSFNDGPIFQFLVWLLSTNGDFLFFFLNKHLEEYL